jgi:hypothetical protein
MCVCIFLHIKFIDKSNNHLFHGKEIARLNGNCASLPRERVGRQKIGAMVM